MGCTAAVKSIRWFKDPETNPNLNTEVKLLKEVCDTPANYDQSLHSHLFSNSWITGSQLYSSFWCLVIHLPFYIMLMSNDPRSCGMSNWWTKFPNTQLFRGWSHWGPSSPWNCKLMATTPGIIPFFFFFLICRRIPEHNASLENRYCIQRAPAVVRIRWMVEVTRKNEKPLLS